MAFFYLLRFRRNSRSYGIIDKNLQLEYGAREKQAEFNKVRNGRHTAEMENAVKEKTSAQEKV